MRTALQLLAALAAAATVATFVPQRPVTPATVAAWRSGDAGIGPGPTATALLDAVGAFDVFGSWWFATLLALLVVSLVGCLVGRVGTLVRQRRRPLTVQLAPPTATVAVRVPVPGSTGMPSSRADGPDPAPTAEPLAVAATLLRRRRFVVARDGTVVVAERGRVAREVGSLAFHTSVLALLAGAVLGHGGGFVGQVDVAEGRAFAETPLSFDVAEPGRWFRPSAHTGFVLTLEDFDLAVHPDGTAADYVATVTVEGRDQPQDGAPVERRDQIRINEPLRHDGARVNLLRYGLAPEVVVRDAAGTEVFHDAVRLRGTGNGTWGGAAKVRLGDPSDGDQLAIGLTVIPSEDDSPVAVVDPRGGDSVALPEDPLVVVELFAGDLGLEDPLPLARVRPSWGPTELVDRVGVRAGEEVALGPGHTIELVRVGSWAGFQVARSPGRGLLLGAATVALGGLAVSLLAHRRRVWIQLERGELVVAGLAWQRHDRADEELRAIAAGMAAALTTPDPGTRAAAPAGQARS